ncbi:heterokaryon incompatibility protein-domain-containing protein [Apiospora saccharicola]|uniref:Heterokaryon incompatibility protein-domain-containing protein n=1 Tax=Apiospora saccharicola TaxID=335842 RepID=A0ABR1TJS4_9PEZI
MFDTLNDLPEDEISTSSSSFTAIMKQVMHGNNSTAQTSRPEQLPLSQSAVNQILSSVHVAELATTYFSRRWFTRVRVLQEVALPDPRRTRILCGAKTTTAMRALLVWPLMVYHLPSVVSRTLNIFLLVRQNLQVLPFPSILLPGNTKMRYSPLLDMLVTTRDRQAQDPCDIIFGIPSLANGLAPAVEMEQGRLLPSLREKLQADYALNTA